MEGQDATNGLGQGAGAQTQAGVDAIQEFAIQTRNDAAEFGQAGGGVFNMTMKSGTNQFHGTVTITSSMKRSTRACRSPTTETEDCSVL